MPLNKETKPNHFIVHSFIQIIINKNNNIKHKNYYRI